MPKFAAVLLALTGVVALMTACTPEDLNRAQIAEVFGPTAGQAIQIATCESELDPAAVSPTGSSFGLFQINRVHRDQFTAVTGQPWSAVYDPHWNTVYAKWLYDQQGWSPWSCRRVL